MYSGKNMRKRPRDFTLKVLVFCKKFAPVYFENMKAGKFVNLRDVCYRLLEVGHFDSTLYNEKQLRSVFNYRIERILGKSWKDDIPEQLHCVGCDYELIEEGRARAIALTDWVLTELEEFTVDTCYPERGEVEMLNGKPDKTSFKHKIDLFCGVFAPLYRDSMERNEGINLIEVANTLIRIGMVDLSECETVDQLHATISHRIRKINGGPARDYSTVDLRVLNADPLKAKRLRKRSRELTSYVVEEYKLMSNSGGKMKIKSGDVMRKLYSFCNRFALKYYEAMKGGTYINLRVVGDHLVAINFFDSEDCTAADINQMIYHQIKKIFQCSAKWYSSVSYTGIKGNLEALEQSRLLTIELTNEVVNEVRDLAELDTKPVKLTIDEANSKSESDIQPKYVRHPKYLEKLCWYLAPIYKENMSEGKGLNIGVIAEVWLKREPWSTNDPAEIALVKAFICRRLNRYNQPRQTYTKLSAAATRVVSSAGTDINPDIKNRSISVAEQVLEVALASKVSAENFKVEKKKPQVPPDSDTSDPEGYIARFDQSMARCKEALGIMCDEFITIVGEASDALVSEKEKLQKDLIEGRKGLVALDKIHKAEIGKMSKRLQEAEDKLSRSRERIRNQSSELDILSRKATRHTASLRQRIGKDFFGRRAGDGEVK